MAGRWQVRHSGCKLHQDEKVNKPALLTRVRPGRNHGHSNDGTSDGMGGGDGQLKVGGNEEPDAGGQHGAQHAIPAVVGEGGGGQTQHMS
jgi:hypothetical protein